MNKKNLSETDDAEKNTPLEKKSYHYSNVDYKSPDLKRQTSDEEKRKGRKGQISREQYEQFEKEYKNMVEKQDKRLPVIGENKVEIVDRKKDDQMLSPEKLKPSICDNRISNTTHNVSDLMSFWKKMEVSPADKGKILLSIQYLY